MADDDKKDLTGIVEFSKKMKETGQIPEAPAGSVMDEVPIEKIEDFESLDAYAKTHPTAEIIPPTPGEYAAPSGLTGTDVAPAPGTGTNEFPTTTGAGDLPPGALDMGSMAVDSGAPAAAPELGVAPPGDEAAPNPEPLPLMEPPAPEPEISPEPVMLAPPEPSMPAPPPSPGQAEDFSVVASGSDELPPSLPDEPSRSDLMRPPPPPQRPEDALMRVRSFSERVSVGRPAVAAAYPFSLLIEGRLAPDEKERLLDLLARENMGIRDLDLEPQFEGGRILIPRISEYAGVLLVMALRGARAKIRLGPSDEIFSTDDTRATESEDPVAGGSRDQGQTVVSEPDHPAERIPITTSDSIPGLRNFVVIDVVTASATLATQVVEAASSVEYNELVEALQRELRYKAYRKGATAVLCFEIKLTQLSLPTHYRLTALGSAVKAGGPGHS